MRNIILDTETTGINPSQGHRIIEIGCVEMIERKLTGNNYHVYINPERVVEQEAIAIHGLTNDFLEDKPVFRDIADEFMEFIKGAQLIIHNAPFDLGFINHELKLLRLGHAPVESCCSVIDTLVMARKKHQGQKNNLDALCKRYFIDNSSRTMHGALLDSEILAEVYLAMTGGQTALSLACSGDHVEYSDDNAIRRLPVNRTPLRVVKPSEAELQQHHDKLEQVHERSGQRIWLDS